MTKFTNFKTWQDEQQAKTTNKPNINERTLLGMLKSVRPHGGHGEQMYINKLLSSIRRLGYTYIIDDVGNIIVNNLSPHDTTSAVMFTSHTDSVHRQESPDGTQQLEFIDADRTFVGVAPVQPQGFTANCLGADCATGNYIMLRLLQANAKGLYCFFRQEESGGIGSDHFRDDPNNQKYWDKLTHCISFDRKGYTSIITEQWGGECASTAFANDLADLIEQADVEKQLERFVADPTGSFTDSANFTDVISECTNLSVGYFSQHTANETQDLVFVDNLCNALERIDWTELNSYRTPVEKYTFSRSSYRQTGGFPDYYYGWYDDAYTVGTSVGGVTSNTHLDDAMIDDYHYFLQQGGIEYAKELVINEPDVAADLLVFLA